MKRHRTKTGNITMVQKKAKVGKKGPNCKLVQRQTRHTLTGRRVTLPLGQIAFKIRHGSNGTTGKKNKVNLDLTPFWGARIHSFPSVLSFSDLPLHTSMLMNGTTI